MTICEIKWIDDAGNPTRDTNPAIYRVRTKARVQQIAGRGVRFEQSQWFNCCAEHFKRMSNPGMEIWECEPLAGNVEQACVAATIADEAFEHAVKEAGYKSRWDMGIILQQSQALRDAYFAKVDADQAMHDAFEQSRTD